MEPPRHSQSVTFKNCLPPAVPPPGGSELLGLTMAPRVSGLSLLPGDSQALLS